MKKLLLSLGALSAVVAPVAAVVACGSTSSESSLDKLKTTDKAKVNKALGLSDGAKATFVASIEKATTEAELTAVLGDLATAVKTSPLNDDKNEVWAQKPGTRVFHVGLKVDGAAKHGTAGTVVNLDPTDTGSYGFHSLFGFLKHTTKAKADATMFAKDDKVVITTKEGEHTITIDDAAVTEFKKLVTDLQARNASEFSSLDAKKHPGTPTAQAQITDGKTIQTQALETLLGLSSLPIISAEENNEIKNWASFHEYKAPAAAGTTYVLSDPVSAASWHAAFQTTKPVVGDILKIGEKTHKVTATDVTEFAKINQENMYRAGDAIMAYVKGTTTTLTIA